MHVDEQQTQESREVDTPPVRAVELVFAVAGACTIVLSAIALATEFDPKLNLIAIVAGVVFGIANLRWWRIIVRALLSANQATTGARHFFFVVNLTFKVSLLLLVIYGLSRHGKEVTRSFLMGFMGFLSLGGFFLLIIWNHLRSRVDSETYSQ